MVGKEHNLVVKALRELAKSHGEYSKVEESRPVEKLHDYGYTPDLWAETKRGEIDVYEVWYGESVKAAVGDIFWSALVPNIRYLKIVCVNKKPRPNFDPWKEKYAREIFTTVSKYVYRDEKSAHDYIHPYIAEVTGEELRNYSKLKEYLKKELEFE